MALAEVPLKTFLSDTVIAYERDEVTRAIIDSHDAAAFAPVAGMAVCDFRDWLFSDAAEEGKLRKMSPGLTPEKAAAVFKIIRSPGLHLGAASSPDVTAL